MANVIATVARIYIYPVKSMAGVAVEEAHIGVNGLLGDRRYAFVRAEQSGSNSFPWMTARQAARMLLYQPRFEHAPTPEQSEPAVHVRTPEGAEMAITDPALHEELAERSRQSLFLLNSATGIFDTQHLSIFSLATVRALAEESGSEIDPRQFRANIYIQPLATHPSPLRLRSGQAPAGERVGHPSSTSSGQPLRLRDQGGSPAGERLGHPDAFVEEQWLERVVRIGREVQAAVTARDTRCMMINLNPDTVSQDARVLRTVAQKHNGQIGVYANVVHGGVVKVGDEVAIGD